ncbi:hypothetical protein PIB30_045648 [Stylosanthes scabra]|uniref:Uncharacterized protein n=1 Tax=Stylosanthes scabra TaxID=79078 RepID=A0ABU6WG81_9FABA|nr:hypothetical protein [Stylosanthes scabra]
MCRYTRRSSGDQLAKMASNYCRHHILCRVLFESGIYVILQPGEGKLWIWLPNHAALSSCKVATHVL